MNKELVIDVSSSEINIALLEDNRLLELQKEKSDVHFSVGDIYLARVKKIMPGLNAAFVDVGFEKDAFLHYLDLGPQFRSLDKYVQISLSKKGKFVSTSKFKGVPDIDKDGKISNVLKAGQVILTQISKEPISTKGPRLTSEISIAGRNLVLIPFSDKVSISQKISSNEEKARLKNLMQSIIPKNYGVIVRTVAEGKKVAELDTELRSLARKWETAFATIREGKPPKPFISEMNRTSTILRDMFNVSFNKIHVNDEAVFHDIKEYLISIAPDKGKIVKLYKGKASIFDQFNINKQIKSLFGKTVSFKEGAYLIVEHTEALHVIDVNSGNRSKSFEDQETSALQVNLSAADEVARQLRLRDMGGIIVVDFIDMQSQENKQKLFDKMREVMESDRAKHNILPLSKFGLMQITRQRVRPEMNINTQEECPSCNGTGKITPTILFTDQLKTRISSYVTAGQLKKFTLRVHPYVAAYLTTGINSIRRKWNREMNIRMKVDPSDSYSYFEYHFFDQDGQEIVL
jgi:ribonuclease G